MGEAVIIWTEDMVATLQAARAAGVPLYRCAEAIGVAYSTAVYKARELGIAGRLNVGRLTGEQALDHRTNIAQAAARWGKQRRG